MKKFIKCLMVLVLSLCFYGCKNDVFNASITEVFYTNGNPENVSSMDSLNRVNELHNGVHYTLVVRFHEPNMDVVKMVMQYGTDGQSNYTITPLYENQNTWWNNVWWNVYDNEDNFELKCYLEDANGNRSSPYTFHVNLRT